VLLVHTRGMGAGLSLSEQIGTAPGSWASVSGSSQVRFPPRRIPSELLRREAPGHAAEFGDLGQRVMGVEVAGHRCQGRVSAARAAAGLRGAG